MDFVQEMPAAPIVIIVPAAGGTDTQAVVGFLLEVRCVITQRPVHYVGGLEGFRARTAVRVALRFVP